MKTIKSIFALILCIVISLTVSIIPNAKTAEYQNKYPLIFVHGMFGWGKDEGINKIIPYWGATTGSLIEYLDNKNIEAYDVSVGPMSSAWDNACEIYAQLTGTTVDYGEAHSKAHNHDRYGRTYTEPLFENWGENKKVHLIGHSHGGQGVRLLAHLLTYGDETEMKTTTDGTVSGLFTGGKENRVESVTTICSPNNGTASYNVGASMYWDYALKATMNIYATLMGRSFLNGVLVDFHLEQFGLTYIPGETTTDDLIPAMIKFAKTSDNVITDLTFEGAQALNKQIKTSKNIHYFCFTYDMTTEKHYLPLYADTHLLLLTGLLLRIYGVPENTSGLIFDESWLPTDGLVNTVSGENPIDEPAKTFDGNIESGLWNVMPRCKGDHGTPIGLMADKDETHKFYDNLTEMLISLED
ncbi:MAG: hypothetical protein IKL16_06685 [Clostridia bacterium]|nr:hypothetical protein [Clostridia bacterium]